MTEFEYQSYAPNSASMLLMAAYEKLTPAQTKRASDLMRTNPTAWPAGLVDFVHRERKKISNQQEPICCWVGQWVREQEDGMSESQRNRAQYRKDNREYLKLDDDQCDMHGDIMQMKMDEWPDELRAYCQEQSQIYGFSGDAVACWVADWLRAGNKLKDPFEGETPEEEEAGRLEALKALAALKKPS